MVGAPEDLVFAGGFERAWIDDRVAKDATVTKLYAATACGSALERHALYLTEFFNSTVDRAVFVGDTIPDGLPSERVDVAPSGSLVTLDRAAAAARTTSSRSRASELAGRRVAEGTAAGLVLWHVGGPVRVREASSNAQLQRNACPD